MDGWIEKNTYVNNYEPLSEIGLIYEALQGCESVRAMSGTIAMRNNSIKAVIAIVSMSNNSIKTVIAIVSMNIVVP